MGAEFSKRKRKVKWQEKETWTGENDADQKAEVDLQFADKENQCVLQWVQTVTTEQERTNLDDGSLKRPKSEMCLRHLSQSLEPLVTKVDLSCCDWLHRIGQSRVDDVEESQSLRPPAPQPSDQSEEIREVSAHSSTPEISSLSVDEKENISDPEINEEASLGSFPASGPAPEVVKNLSEREEVKKSTDCDGKVDVLVEIEKEVDSRKMTHQPTSTKKLKNLIAGQSAKLKPKPKKKPQV